LIESANTILLTEKLNSSHFQIIGQIGSYHEFTPIPPRLQLLKQLLLEKDYEGPIRDLQKKGNVYTFYQLQCRIQASELELKRALLELNAFELTGFCRILNVHYEADVLDLILTEATTHDWSIQKVPEKEVLQCLNESEYDSCSVLQCLRNFSAHQFEPHQLEGETYWSLDSKKLAIFKAVQLLIEKEWSLQIFLTKWRDCIPDEWEIEPNLIMLKGNALVTQDNNNEAKILYYPLSALPLEPQLRIKELFKKQKQWKLDDITPYLLDLATANLSVEQFLLKYARVTQTSGERLYCTK